MHTAFIIRATIRDGLHIHDLIREDGGKIFLRKLVSTASQHGVSAQTNVEIIRKSQTSRGVLLSAACFQGLGALAQASATTVCVPSPRLRTRSQGVSNFTLSLSLSALVSPFQIRSLATDFGDGVSLTCRAHCCFTFCSYDKTICSFQVAV